MINTGRTVVLAADKPQGWHGETPTMPPNWVLDKVADRTMSAGWTPKRNKVCPSCGLMRSIANRCDCNS